MFGCPLLLFRNLTNLQRGAYCSAAGRRVARPPCSCLSSRSCSAPPAASKRRRRSAIETASYADRAVFGRGRRLPTNHKKPKGHPTQLCCLPCDQCRRPHLSGAPYRRLQRRRPWMRRCLNAPPIQLCAKERLRERPRGRVIHQTRPGSTGSLKKPNLLGRFKREPLSRWQPTSEEGLQGSVKHTRGEFQGSVKFKRGRSKSR